MKFCKQFPIDERVEGLERGEEARIFYINGADDRSSTKLKTKICVEKCGKYKEIFFFVLKLTDF